MAEEGLTQPEHTITVRDTKEARAVVGALYSTWEQGFDAGSNATSDVWGEALRRITARKPGRDLVAEVKAEFRLMEAEEEQRAQGVNQ